MAGLSIDGFLARYRGRSWRVPGAAVHEVGGTPGGECLLLVGDGGGAVLVDAGFAWCAPAVLRNVRRVLGPDPRVDWLLLTHSHYDHCGGAGYLREALPGCRLAASAHAARVFERPGAWATMRKLNAFDARQRGLAEFPDVPDVLPVDRVLAEADEVRAGSLALRVMEAPGHTKCCLAFYSEQADLLISCETGGVAAGPLQGPAPAGLPADAGEVVCPACLVSWQGMFDFIARSRALAPQRVVGPHYGLMEGAEAAGYLASSEFYARYAVRLAAQAAAEGLGDEQIAARFKAFFYTPYVAAGQPEPAFDLNATHIIPQLLQAADALGAD